jgi:hypothetical protein
MIPPADYFRTVRDKYKKEVKADLAGNEDVYRTFKKYSDHLEFVRPILIKELAGKIPHILHD